MVCTKTGTVVAAAGRQVAVSTEFACFRHVAVGGAIAVMDSVMGGVMELCHKKHPLFLIGFLFKSTCGDFLIVCPVI